MRLRDELRNADIPRAAFRHRKDPRDKRPSPNVVLRIMWIEWLTEKLGSYRVGCLKDDPTGALSFESWKARFWADAGKAGNEKAS